MAKAQVLYGSLTGTVIDPSAAVVPGAQVEAVNVQTGAAKQVITNEAGVYLFSQLLPGTYRVTISASGFAKIVTENIFISVNSVRRLDAALQLAKATETITVTANAETLQTDRADVAHTLKDTQIRDLPLTSSQGRNYQALYNVIPGFGVPTERNSAGGNPQRSMTTNVNGLSSQGNSTRIDGALNTYIWLPANVAYVPPADSIQEINVVTNSFDAEQGSLGAAVNVITKSGTNEFHGQAYEFHNDNALRAQNRFNPPNFRKPKDIMNQFGANLGGPAIKNKLFFFTDWESTRRQQFATRSLTVPNPANMFDSAGNVSFASLVPAGTNCNVTKVAGCIFDANTGNANGTARAAFANNTIPAARIDPAAKTMLSRIDKAGYLNDITFPTSNNYQATHPAAFNRDNWDEKVNYTPNSRSMIFVRYSLSQSNIIDTPSLGEAIGDATAGGQLGNALSRIQSVGVGSSYTFANRMLADFNFGYTRQRLGAQAPDLALGPIRWEFYPMAVADHGGARVFDPADGNVYIGGRGSVPLNSGVDAGSGQFLPRVGIAYRLGANSVIRAGYGLMTDNNNYRFLRNAYPVTTNTDNNPSGFVPAAFLTAGRTLAPYPTLTGGIPTATFPDISTGIVPLPNNTGTTTIAKSFHRGHIHSYNLMLQHQFKGFMAEAEHYQHSASWKSRYQRNSCQHLRRNHLDVQLGRVAVQRRQRR